METKKRKLPNRKLLKKIPTFYDLKKLQEAVLTKRCVEYKEDRNYFQKRCNVGKYILMCIERGRPVSFHQAIKVCRSIGLNYKEYLL